MINFIIYSSNNNLNKQIKGIISNFMLNDSNYYKIFLIDKYSDDLDKEIEGQNIYILSINDNNNEEFLLAKSIRDKRISINDQIIFISSNKHLVLSKCYSEIMYYDFLIIDKSFERNLIECISSIYSIFNRLKFLNIKIKGEIYRIPYNDINYIEKCKCENCSYIHTKNKVYKSKNNIVYFEKILNDRRFFKTHRSCIVNINNISKIDINDLKIYFINDCTNYLSRDRKKDLLNQVDIINWGFID